MERHRDHFEPDALDPDWIPVVGQHEDWISLTKDKEQRYKQDERDAIMRSGVAHFIHIGKLTHPQLAESFVMAADRIIRFREKYGRPFIARVYRPERKTAYLTVPGEVRMVLTFAAWQAQQGR